MRGGPSSPTTSWPAPAATCAWTTAATSVRTSTGSRASTTARPRPHMLERGAEHERFEAAVDVGDHAQALQEIDAEIARLEQALDRIVTYGLPDERDPGERSLLLRIGSQSRRLPFLGEVTMASALDVFRAQREAAEEVQTRLREATDALHALTPGPLRPRQRSDVSAAAERRASLARAGPAPHQSGGSLRRHELHRFWPAVWKRWAMIVLLMLATGFVSGAGSVWAGRPYEAELANLRARVELGDEVARRVLEMTPAERRQFEVLMQWRDRSR